MVVLVYVEEKISLAFTSDFSEKNDIYTSDFNFVEGAHL